MPHDIETLLAALARAPDHLRARVLKDMPANDVRAFEEEWGWQAHGGQREPAGDWRVWMIMAGRGFGKTRAGAEWVWARARAHPGARIALVGATLDEVERVMVRGEAGLLACARTGERARWVSGRGELHFPSGATGFALSAARPESLRGPEHHFAWCDELAKWTKADKAWDNLMLGLRLGEAPRAIVTTTPQSVPILKRIERLKRVAVTRGRTGDNLHLAADYHEAMHAAYAGTRLGAQELDGVLIEEVDGALWTAALIDASRVEALDADAVGALSRVVAAVDPPGSVGGDACGIVVAGLGRDGIGYVLADHSVAGLRPEGWARAVAAAAATWGADRVVAEKNNGGEMVESVLRSADAGLPVTLVSATRGKGARAEPVSLLFERGRARLAGRFPALEAELMAMTAAGYAGGGSPDRADAMVWALDILLRPRAEPRVVSF